VIPPHAHRLGHHTATPTPLQVHRQLETLGEAVPDREMGDVDARQQDAPGEPCNAARSRSREMVDKRPGVRRIKAWRRSKASPPRTSATRMRSGRCRRVARNKSRLVRLGKPACFVCSPANRACVTMRIAFVRFPEAAERPLEPCLGPPLPSRNGDAGWPAPNGAEPSSRPRLGHFFSFEAASSRSITFAVMSIDGAAHTINCCGYSKMIPIWSSAAI
jgi:hypothetical protein